MNTSRRRFLGQSGALTASTLVSNLSWLGMETANAQSLSGYKALVGIFLFGGNDSNNTIVPITDYASYALVRTAASNVEIPQASLLPINPPSAGATYGLHPNLAPIHPFFASQKLAAVINMGTLLAPLTKAQYQAGINRPKNLFSHSDQQNQVQGLIVGSPIRTGWGGRVSDKISSANVGAKVPTAISVSGSVVFGFGQSTGQLVIPATGGVTLTGATSDVIGQARFNGLQQLLAAGSSNQIVGAGASVLQGSITASNAVNPILTAAASANINTAFTGVNSNLASELKQVARMIEAQVSLGVKRQFFLVSMGGYDTHSNTVNNQNTLFNQLAPAMKAFYDFTVLAGVSNSVTTFTMSDFNRTFVGNGNAGVDHAWGGHALVLGGAVKGGDFYGTFPNLALKGPDDSGNNGAWIPTISVDQFGATLASWFGVAAVDLPYVFPNIGNFSSNNLGFV